MGLFDVLKSLFTPVSVENVSAQQLAEMVENGDVVLIDVRSPGEFGSGHIEGARNIPLSHFSLELKSLTIPKDAQVVAYCRSANRSVPAVKMLKSAGYENARQLGGGIMSWQSAGLPTV